jgi:hypothetical protein
MADKNLFTAENVWKGGFYELFILPRTNSHEEACALLKAPWSCPFLDGCYPRRDCEPATQTRVQPCETDNNPEHLYGLATLSNGKVIACGSYSSNYAVEADSPLAYRAGFYLPMGALSTAYPVGAYPFGPMDRVSEWKAQVDSLLVQTAKWVHARSLIRLALIGFEVNVAAVTPASIQANGIPKERDDGILWDDGGGLKWYPATRP